MKDDLKLKDVENADWFSCVGPRLRRLWDLLPFEFRNAIADDAVEQADRDWPDGIDRMGEDA